MDFIAYDAAHCLLWVLAGDTGSVDVIDLATDKVSRVQGFATKEVERNGRKRTMGPSSVVVGDGVGDVGNRGDDSIGAINAASLERAHQLDSMPDAIALVPPPRKSGHDPGQQLDRGARSRLRSALPVNTSMTLPARRSASPWTTRGLVYTNLEDKDRTVAVDAKTRQVVHTWLPDCGEVRGASPWTDKRNVLFVACTTRAALDAGHDGKLLGSIDVGDGIDAIDYLESRHSSTRAPPLREARRGPFDQKNQLLPVETIATVPQRPQRGGWTEKGVADPTDAHDGSILVVDPPR